MVIALNDVPPPGLDTGRFVFVSTNYFDQKVLAVKQSLGIFRLNENTAKNL